MREPKKIKSSPTTGAATNASSDNGLPISSPLNRQPKTPKQSEADTPNQWPPQSQTPNSQMRAIKSMESSSEMPPPTPDSLRSPVAGILTIPSSPLDQFKKEDPMEKLAQMTTNLGSVGAGGSLLNSLRSPSAAPSTPSSYIPMSPGPNAASRSVGVLSLAQQQQQQAPPPHHMMSGGLPQQHHHLQQQQQQDLANIPGPINHGMPPADQPYLPNQNVIFVFDTNLANQAAEAVEREMVQTILEYHQGLEGTRKILNRCHMEGRGGWNLPTSGHQMGHPPRQQMMPNNFRGQQMRPEFNSVVSGRQPTPQLQSKQMKLEKLRQVRENLLPPEKGNQVAPPPPYPYAPAGMMPSQPPPRPARPSNGSQKNRHRAAPAAQQLDNNTPIGMEEANYQAQQQQEMMFKTENINAGPGGFPPVVGSESYGQAGYNKDGTTSVMPVPSPQPIQYVNSQLDQEVIIQKQPNRNFMGGGPRGGMMLGNGQRMMGDGQPPMNMEHFNPYSDHQRMPGPPMGMQQQGQHNMMQFQPPPNFNNNQQCMSDLSGGGMQRHHNSTIPCSPTQQQVFQGHQFGSSMRAQFHGHGCPPPSSSLPPHPQTVNNTYVSAKIAIEHVNIQNVPGYPDNAGGGGVPQYQQTSGNYSTDYSQLHDASPGQQQHMQQIGPPSSGGGGKYQQQAASSFDGPQGHIRPNAPNTIHYLPNRLPPPKQSRPPLNLDFLNPWTASQQQQQQVPRMGSQQAGIIGNAPLPPPQQHQQMPYPQQQQPMYSLPNNGLVANGGGVLFSQSSSQVDQYQAAADSATGQNSETQFTAGYQQFQQQLYASNVASSRQQQPQPPQLGSTPTESPQQ